ncbi:MAG TPA: HNH endonuclease signature motif containing protein [Marinobacter sp.]|uniref:HNH endonuclease signature motif containing protein n=1 Tax=Marinobacter sp. TaxID=50741 RepID=UPI002D801098|nr:HNH endonuclease signature motif containing protein [Marinobacter sp.]HET8799663.1 HNH endonuclease signature motif containing protein [Marinobacter sp.]
MQKWTVQRDERLRDLYPDTNNRTIANVMSCSYSAIQNRARTLGLRKSPDYLEREKPGCFRKGLQPWNKGTHFQSGGRSIETQFKAGQRPQTWTPIGTETIDKDGYLKRKVRDDAPPGMSRKNWKFVHVLKWEEYNGRPVPPKHIVRLKDGNKRNFAPENLALISMGENAVLNKLFAMPDPPPGGFDVLLNLARIRMATTKRKKELTA